jgi:O-methyltransferase
MGYPVRWRMKAAVARWGVDSRLLENLQQLPRIGSWANERVPEGCPHFPTREGMYAHLAATFLTGPIDYLEFGVHRGKSMREWSRLVPHPEARFVGFDSFEGLPEDWEQVGTRVDADVFDVGGRAPEIDDPRVSFETGWFQDTLPRFLDTFDPQDQLVVNCDADIYSSTLYALTQCDRILVPGTIVIFDEFASVLNEFSALADYCAAYRRDYEVIAHAQYFYGHLAVRMK